MNPTYLEAVATRESKATKAPWFQFWGGEPNMIGASLGNNEVLLLAEIFTKSEDGRNPDADFMAHAREDVPNLLAEVKKLEAENQQLRAEVERLKQPMRWVGPSVFDDPQE
jgi:cell division protein FtsB